jgi:putative transposase
VVVPGIPHLVTQRGNRRPQTSFADGDYAACRDQLAESCMKAGVAVWAWCLMPNPVHLILVPGTAESLRATLADAHRRHSRRINFREGWRGYLWQGRFVSVAMAEPHLAAPPVMSR